MIRFLFIFIVLCSFNAFAEVKISDVSIRKGPKSDYPVTIYLKIHNTGEKLDYLLGAQIIESESSIVSVNKTVIERGVARIIRINQLALPAKSIINLSPQGIYLVARNINSFMLTNSKLSIKFCFKYSASITYNFSSQ